jgi:hypothetical protein
VPGALAGSQVADQDLAAPHGAVGAEPGAVEDRPHRGAELVVLGEARRQVRVVVLHRHVLDPLAGERVRGRQIVRVQVVDDHLRGDREQPLEVRDARLERTQRLGVLEVADVVGDPCAAPARDAERVLELGAAREHVPGRRDREREQAGDRPAGAPERQRPPAGDPQHRVVRAGVDRPVVQHEHVGDAAQARERVLVLVGDRLVGHVAAGHHQRLADVGEQQVVHRAVRQHHAELCRARGHRRGHAGAGPARREDDRPVAADQQALLERPEPHELPGRRRIRRHQRERLLLAVLAGPQRGHGPFVRRQAGEMEPADPLHGGDPALAQGGGDRRERHAQPGAALRARVGLRVEPAIGRVVVLRRAAVAHGEARHRRQRAVVRHVADDREAGPAVRAVDERVAVAAVGRVEQLPKAVLAGRGVGRDLGVGGAPAGRLHDREAAFAARRHRLGSHELDHRQRRRLRGQPRHQRLDRLRRPLGLDHDSALVVAHEPGQAQPARQPMDVGPEPDALDDAVHPHAHAPDRGGHSCGRDRISESTSPKSA